MRSGHPALAGLGRMRDFDAWNGGQGVLYTSALTPLSEAVLLLGDTGTAPLEAERASAAMVAAEFRERSGTALVSQAAALARFELDPAARRWLAGLLAHAVSPGFGREARPAPGIHRPLAVVADRDAVPLDLSAACNRGFRDNGGAVAGWDGGGPRNDLAALPTGTLRLAGVPFRILDPRSNGGRSCLVLGGGRLPLPERSAPIPVGARLRALHFLHAVSYGAPGDRYARYLVRYRDGVVESIPLVCGEQAASWWGATAPALGQVAWIGRNPAAGVISLGSYRWTNPRPESELDSLELESLATGRTVPILVAVTGER